MLKRFTALASLLMLFAAASCTKEPEPSSWNHTMDEMYDCHTGTGLDSTDFAAALVGTWDWRFVRSTSWSYYESEDEYLGYELQFNADGSLVLNQNDTAQITGTWELENSWIDFTLNVQPYIPTTFGAMVHCDEYLMFYSSPMDGPDHLYEKQ